MEEKCLEIRNAINNTDLEKFENILYSNFDVNLQDNLGNSLLHWIVSRNHYLALKSILKYNKNILFWYWIIDKIKTRLSTDIALYLKCFFPRQLLNINLKNKVNGDTPILIAGQNSSSASFKLLLDAKPDLTIVNNYHQNIYHVIVNSNRIDKLYWLMDSNLPCDINLNVNIYTPLLTSISTKKVDMALKLIDYGADINKTTSFYVNHELNNPLTMAVFHNESIIVRKLVLNDVNLNQQDGRGNTALHWAVRCGNAHIFNYLLECGADFTIKNNDYEDVMDILIRLNRRTTYSSIPYNRMFSVMKDILDSYYDINDKTDYEVRKYLKRKRE